MLTIDADVFVLSLFGLTQDRARLSANMGTSCGLRGADAVYAPIAQEFGTTLITWDTALPARSILAVPTMKPTDWRAANPTI